MQEQGRWAPLASLDAEGRDIVERLGGQWEAHGGLCRCPAHRDNTPSLSVRPGRRRLLFHCFAGCEQSDVIDALRRSGVLGRRVRLEGSQPCTSPDDGRSFRAAAARLWADARHGANTPAERYLRLRGLQVSCPELRYHPRTPHGRGTEASFQPAMIAAVRDESGLVGVHRTFLDASSGRLARLPHAKRALGRPGRGAVRLFAPRGGLLGLAEGIENALAATQLTGIPCWATLGTERFAHVALPAGVERLVLFLDNDAGGRRAEHLARRHAGNGVAIEARYPMAEGSDWNDELLSKLPAARSAAAGGALEVDRLPTS